MRGPRPTGAYCELARVSVGSDAEVRIEIDGRRFVTLQKYILDGRGDGRPVGSPIWVGASTVTLANLATGLFNAGERLRERPS